MYNSKFNLKIGNSATVRLDIKRNTGQREGKVSTIWQEATQRKVNNTQVKHMMVIRQGEKRIQA